MHMYTRLRIGCVIFCGLSLTQPASAQQKPKVDNGIIAHALERLLDDDMQNAFSGRRMEGVYKNPRQSSGTQFFTEDFNADGTTRYYEGVLVDNGLWSTEGDQLCFGYTGPLAGNLSCFAVYRLGTCYYSYNPAEIFNGKPLIPNAWSVKSKLDNDLSTCEDLMS